MSSGSMSVQSLIDKYSGKDGPNESMTSGKSNQGDTGPSAGIEIKKEFDDKKTGLEEDNKYDRTNVDRKREIDKSGVHTLLGPSVRGFPYSEEAFVEALKLRTEQERTKQEYYRLEIANKNMILLQQALKAQVPANLIPLFIVGESKDREHNAKKREVARPLGSPGRTARRDYHQHEPTGSIGTLPSRLGGGGMSPGTRRTLSPAKVGAAAVANLVTPTTPYRNLRRPSTASHQRHYSLPNDSPSMMFGGKVRPLPTTENEKREINTLAPINTKHANTTATQQTIPLADVLGAATSSMSTPAPIQVKPSPAQPLQKGGKLMQPPSQESMTSFQHIIQFHHWKPENGGQGLPFPHQPTTAHSSTMPPFPKAHKRHKSSTENMAVDSSSSNPQSYGDMHGRSSRGSGLTSSEYQEDENIYEDNDITMDTSTLTETENPKTRTGRHETLTSDTSDNGSSKFPRDVLSPSNS